MNLVKIKDNWYDPEKKFDIAGELAGLLPIVIYRMKISHKKRLNQLKDLRPIEIAEIIKNERLGNFGKKKAPQGYVEWKRVFVKPKVRSSVKLKRR